MLDINAIGKKIHDLRINANYNQDQIADALYVSRQAVSRWELGQTLPSVDNLIELCKLFRISFEEILCLDEPILIDPDNIFQGHDRAFIIQNIISGKIEVDLSTVFYQFSDMERMTILKHIKNNHLKTDINSLWYRLTPTEMSYLGGKKYNEY